MVFGVKLRIESLLDFVLEFGFSIDSLFQKLTQKPSCPSCSILKILSKKLFDSPTLGTRQNV